MEENKYYIPKIEEFHVGFEYESATLRRLSPWAKKSATTTDIDEVKVVLDIYPEGIRVKYLDKEDIESLGWKKDSKIEDAAIIYKKELYYLVFWCSETTYIEIDCEGYDLSFNGYCKNKSELLKIMKQIGCNV